jgi:hypothetical protein
MCPAEGQCRAELAAIDMTAGLNLDEFSDEFPIPTIQVGRAGLALRLKTETGLTLPISRNSKVRDASAWHGYAVMSLCATFVRCKH